MPGLGLGLAEGYGAGGTAQSLREILKQRMLQAEMAERQRKAMADEAARERTFQTLQEQEQYQRGRDVLTDTRYDTDRAERLAKETKTQTEADAKKAVLETIIGQAPDPANRAVLRLLEQNVSGATPHMFHAPDVEAQEKADAVRENLAEVEAEADIRGRVGAKYREPSAPKEDRLVPVEQSDGKGGTTVTYLPESSLRGQTFQKPSAVKEFRPTGIERRAVQFFNRGKEADNIATRLETDIAKSNLLEQGQLQYAPNWAQSGNQQSYRQAQRTFTEARLRAESGAAVPLQEYENDARTYFAQPGDTPATILQKAQSRQDVLDGLAQQGGKAFDEFYGEGEFENYQLQRRARPGQGGKPGAGAAPAKEYDFVNGKLVPRK